MSEYSSPKIVKKEGVSKVWILPIVTAIVGIIMAIHNWQNRGVNIEISLANAEGIEVEKTKVKLKDVEIGVVKGIRFNDDATQVILSVEIQRPMKKFIQTDSKFWVVKPRVSSSEISGIGTLLSGNYIALLPGDSNKFEDEFDALDNPPINMGNKKGIRISLVSSEAKSLEIGSKIFYRGFVAGQVENVRFDLAKREVIYSVFIEAPYNTLVTENTNFWNASGVTVDTANSGLKLKFSSIDSIFAGAIEFDIPENKAIGKPLVSTQRVRLYKSREDMENRSIYEYFEVIAFFKSSISGVNVGAPVEYRGIRVGTVGDFIPLRKLDEMRREHKFANDGSIPVIIRIEPERFIDDRESLESNKLELEQWVMGGMQASITTDNILAGTRKISMDLSDRKIKKVRYFGKYLVMPTGNLGLNRLVDQVSVVLKKVAQMPINEAFNDLRDVLKGFKPDSTVYKNIDRSLIKLQSSLNELQPVLKKLNNRPNSLIFGETNRPDIVPRAKDK